VFWTHLTGPCHILPEQDERRIAHVVCLEQSQNHSRIEDSSETENHQSNLWTDLPEVLYLIDQFLGSRSQQLVEALDFRQTNPEIGSREKGRRESR
jgi:hypothetical protein